jgi:hypothetical protein
MICIKMIAGITALLFSYYMFKIIVTIRIKSTHGYELDRDRMLFYPGRAARAWDDKSVLCLRNRKNFSNEFKYLVMAT